MSKGERRCGRTNVREPLDVVDTRISALPGGEGALPVLDFCAEGGDVGHGSLCVWWSEENDHRTRTGLDAVSRQHGQTHHKVELGHVSLRTHDSDDDGLHFTT